MPEEPNKENSKPAKQRPHTNKQDKAKWTAGQFRNVSNWKKGDNIVSSIELVWRKNKHEKGHPNTNIAILEICE